MYHYYCCKLVPEFCNTLRFLPCVDYISFLVMEKDGPVGQFRQNSVWFRVPTEIAEVFFCDRDTKEMPFESDIR